MIRRLRRVQGVAAVGGLLLLPSLLALGLNARVSMPRNFLGPWDRLRGSETALPADGPLQWAISIGPRRRSLDIQPSRDLQEPDLLVYWCPGTPLVELPEEAVLLGVLAGPEARRFALPEVARGAAEASVLVYSLVRAEVVASLRVPAQGASR